MSELSKQLRAEVDPDLNEHLDVLLERAADEIDSLEGKIARAAISLLEIEKMGGKAHCDGSPAIRMGNLAHAARLELKSHVEAADEIASLRAQLASGKAYDDLREQHITKLEAQLAEQAELLKNPAAVHLNMLSGAIALPSWLNIRHLYPEEFAKLDAQLASARKAAIEECAKYLERGGFRYSQGFDIIARIRELAETEVK